MKILTALFALFILAIVILADMDRLDFLAAIYDFPFGDKAGHFILFGILAFLIVLTLLRSRSFPDPSTLRQAQDNASLRTSPKGIAVVAALILALAIGLEEWSQNFFPGRTSSWMDLLFSYAGVTLGAWLAYKKSPHPISSEGIKD